MNNQSRKGCVGVEVRVILDETRETIILLKATTHNEDFLSPCFERIISNLHQDALGRYNSHFTDEAKRFKKTKQTTNKQNLLKSM